MMTGALESRAPSSAATTVDDEVQFWVGSGSRDENFTQTRRGVSQRPLLVASCEGRERLTKACSEDKAQERFASGERRGCQRAFSSIISLVISSRVAAHRDSELQTRYTCVSMRSESA